MEDVRQLARRHDDAFNSQDADARRAIEAADIEVVLPGGMTLAGHDQVLQVTRTFWEALPDAKLTIDAELAEDDVVVYEGTLAGTHTGTFRTPQGEIRPTGNPVSLRYASVKRFEGGRLVSEHLYFDQLEFLQQLGAMPGGGGA